MVLGILHYNFDKARSSGACSKGRSYSPCNIIEVQIKEELAGGHQVPVSKRNMAEILRLNVSYRIFVARAFKSISEGLRLKLQ